MKKTGYLITSFAIFLIIVGILIFCTDWTDKIRLLITNYAGVIVTGLGFVIAIYQLRFATNKYFEDIEKKNKDYLDLLIKTEKENDYYSIKTQVLNKSGEDKGIEYSFLLITKQDENINDKIAKIISEKKWSINITSANDLINFKGNIEAPLFWNNVLAIIPLKFYYEENLRIGNENPSYSYSFDNNIVKLQKGIYSVRFFVFPEQDTSSHRYHRCTVDSLIIK
jgi:tRNA(Leu) C34 or U34 (ribose-2'-O)-methylase TrmL